MTSLLFCGCASVSSRTVLGPDGAETHLISGGSANQCGSRAKELCRGKYKTVSKGWGLNSSGDKVYKLTAKCEK